MLIRHAFRMAMSESERDYMRVSRIAASSVAIITAALGLSMATAGPASAATGTWVYYGNKNPITSSASTWRCGPTEEVNNRWPDVVAQVCAVRTAKGDAAQGAVIVRNNGDTTSDSVDASVSLRNSADGSLAGWWDCGPTGIPAHSWKVCFGKTLDPKLADVYADATVNGDFLVRSPNL
ncbi:hypothetical protein ACFWMJ_35315 [Streptomyces hawaiiensis]|uniref:hypothetical protein n=1 Tax=Streptomyces hawaiiensis TaxID=67305 RepID=UPI00365BF15C